MAILQEANAVFYHPLDDLTEALQAQVWTGSSKQMVGKVSFARGQALASVSYGSAAGLSSVGPNARFTASCVLDATRIVTAFTDGNNTLVSCAVGTVAGNTLTYGLKATFSQSDSAAIDIACVSPTKFVLVHNARSRVGTVSGTDITFGPDVTIPGSPNASTAEAYTEVAALTASLVVATYPSSGNTVKVIAGVVGAAAVTWSTATTVATLATIPWIRVSAMAADRFIMVYGTRVGIDPVFVMGGFVLGTSIAMPDAAVQAALAAAGSTTGGFAGHKRVGIVSTGAATAMLVYIAAGSPDPLLVSAIDMPATAPVVGPPSVMSDPVGSDDPTRGVGEPLGEITVGWSGTHVTVTHATQMLAGATTGGGASHEIVTHLVSLNAAGLPVERGRAQPFLFGNISQPRTGSATLPSGLTVVSQLTSGSVTSKAGDVTPSALDATTTTFGAEREFVGLPSAQNRITALDATRFVVVYSANAAAVSAKVATVSGKDITYGPDTLVLAASSSVISVATLSATTFVVAYRDSADLSKGKARVGLVAGTSIVFGLETAFVFDAGGEFSGGNVAALSSTTFVVVYNNPVAGNDAAKVGTVLGTDITFGAEKVFYTPGAGSLSATALSSTMFVVAYQVAATSGRAIVGTVSGTDITFGGEMTFNLAPTSWISAAAISATQFVVAYQDGTSGLFHGTANVGTVSGTTITFGAKSKFLAAMSEHMSVAAISPTKVVVAYVNNPAGSHGVVSVGTVSGTDISFGADAEFLSATGASDLQVAADAAGQYVVVYADQADGNHGTAKVGASYPSAAAATRLAFSSWTRRGIDMVVGARLTVDPTGPVIARLSLAALSDTAFLAVYGSSAKAVARVLTLSGTTLTAGPESTLIASFSDTMNVVAMSPTKVVAVTGGSIGPNRAGWIGTVSGTDVTWVPGAQFGAAAGVNLNNNMFLEALDASKVLLAYADGTGTVKRSVVGTVSGADLTWGAETTFSDGNSLYGLAVLGASSAVVSYETEVSPTQRDVTFRSVTVSGASITLTAASSPPALSIGGPSTALHRIAAIDSDRFLIVYNDNTDLGSNFTEPDFRQSFAMVVTVSGADFTLGPKAQLDGSAVRPLHLVRTAADRFLVTYWNWSNSQGNVLYASVADVSGTTAAFSGTRVAAMDQGDGVPVWPFGAAASGGAVVVLGENNANTELYAAAVVVKG